MALRVKEQIKVFFILINQFIYILTYYIILHIFFFYKYVNMLKINNL